MIRITTFVAALGLGAAFCGTVYAEATIGQAAPAFTLTDTDGNSHSLADYAGKTVILEWTNYDCPFVRKHYDAGNMQKQQGDAVSAGAVWFTINSSATGKQGHISAERAKELMASDKHAGSAYLFDPDGTVGKAYGAQTTPHMYIIDGDGVLRYKGGIDSIPSADQADLDKASQYVPAALAELAAGQAVTNSSTRPYGCSVKYPET